MKLPTIAPLQSEEDLKTLSEKNHTRLKEIVENFKATLNNMSYDKNWKMKDYFTPLEITALVFGFDPNYFYYDSKIGKIDTSTKLAYMQNIIKEYSSFKERSLSSEIMESVFIPLNIYLKKIKKMHFLFDVIIENLRFHKIYYDGLNNNVNYVKDIPFIRIYKSDIYDFLAKKGIESEFFETNIINNLQNNENNFYKIPKNHRCVSVKAKAMIETLLHFIENEQDLHDAKSGVSDAITKHIQDNNTYKISGTAIKREITPILNWTHQKELEKLK